MTEEDPTVWMPGWQRVLIALVFLLLMNPAGAIGGPVGTVLTVGCALVSFAAFGFVELGMALWYRARRALQRGG